MHSRSTTLRRMVATLGIAVLGMIGVVAAPAQADDDTVTVDLLGINDFHGRIEEEDRVPGAVRLASAVERIRAEDSDTLFMAAGDNFGGSTFTTLINDENPAVQVLNAMELDVSSLGNHEFDKGQDVLQARIAGTGDYAGENQIDWPYLGANVEGATPPFEGHEIFTTDSGVEVGVIGMVTPTVPTLVSPGGIEGLAFTDMAETAEAEVAALEAEGADLIVITVHEGAPNGDAVHDYSNDFGKLVETSADLGVTAIFSGHTHKKYNEWVDGADDHRMAVLQTGSYTENLGRVTVEYDQTTDEAKSVVTDMIDLADEPVLEGNLIIEEINTIIADAQDEAEERGKVVVGQVGADTNRAVKPDGSDNRAGESTAGNLIADVQLDIVANLESTTTPPEIAFMNPGGIRSDLTYDADIGGDVTYREVATMQPFGNTLETFELTGAQVVEALEQQWQPETSRRPYLKLGISDRLSYFFDPEDEKGSHITEVLFDGEPIDEDATFQVVANNFLAAGGDSFFALGEGTNYADTGMSDLEAFVDYFEEAGEAEEPVKPDYLQRSIGAHWLTSQDDVYGSGDEISLDLSSIVFSTTEPKPDELEISLVNPETDEAFELGAAEITDEVLALTDETGIAHVRFTVPEIDELSSEPEMWQLLAADEVNGYALWFDVQLAGEDVEAPPTEEPTEEPTTPAPPTEEPTAPAPPTTAPPGGDLPETGAEVTGPLAGGALLLALGGLLVALRRRNGSLV